MRLFFFFAPATQVYFVNELKQQNIKQVWPKLHFTLHAMTVLSWICAPSSNIALFLGLPRLQFLITCSMRKRFCILQAIKNWSRGRPRNGANSNPLFHLANYECTVHRYNPSSSWDKLASFPGSCAVEEERGTRLGASMSKLQTPVALNPVQSLSYALGKKIAIFLLHVHVKVAKQKSVKLKNKAVHRGCMQYTEDARSYTQPEEIGSQ